MADLVNQTPFSPLTFCSLDAEGEEFQVIVLKGTFDVVPHEQPAAAASQDPVRTTPEPYDPEQPLSLRFEDDLAPFKPNADVLVTGSSYAPGGKPAHAWVAGVRVGQVAKRLLVTGPRVWVHAPLVGWTLGDPEPARHVRLSYDRAFGGVAKKGDTEQAHACNPIGRGFANPSTADKSRPLPAPSLLSPGSRPPTLGKTASVEGFSPIHRSWQPRLAKAGTFDEAWATTRRPRMPEDFDSGFYNCAHPDLIYPGYPRGGEQVRLENLCRGYDLVAFDLPQIVIGVAITDRSGFRYGSAARLDTVHIDTDQMKLWLVWRATLPLMNDGVQQIEAVMTESFGAVQARAEAAQAQAQAGRRA